MAKNKVAAKRPAPNTSSMGDLWARLGFVLFALLIYRLGAHIPLPGIDPVRLESIFTLNQGTVLSLFNVFSGGALERMSIFALGIMPYISASIIVQLMSAVVPSVEQLRKEGESGRRKINQYTRYLTVFISTLQGFGIAAALASQQIAFNPDINFYFVSTVSFVTGSVFLMWLGEQVTEKGIGNGISLLIFASIVSGIPPLVGQAATLLREGDLSLIIGLIFLLFVLGTVIFVIFIERGQRRITINYANRMTQGGMYARQTSHLPLKINMAGVIPAIFASSLLLFPASMGQWFGSGSAGSYGGTTNQIDTTAPASDSIGGGLFDSWYDLLLILGPGQPLYNFLYAAAVIFFCFFYTALVFNPKDVASNLQRSGALIPGIRPGPQTANYIDNVLTRLTLFGSLYITAVSLLPQMILVGMNVPFFFAGTSILIVVVVMMDFLAQVQSHIMSSQYGSVLQKANLTGSATRKNRSTR